MRTGLQNAGMDVCLNGKSKHLECSIKESHKEWTSKAFRQSEAIIFIGACGIAVRSIAPFVKSKKSDPAVLVIDECGQFVISLLSGHLGGANELTEIAAHILSAVPVITTATDIHQLFAVDVFAKKNHCDLLPLKYAKDLSAAMLSGELIGFYSDVPWDGKMPDELIECDLDGKACDGSHPDIGIAVSVETACEPFPMTVHVIPRIVSLGVGCRKGKEYIKIEYAIRKMLEERGIFSQALEQMASIDLKKEEAGLLLFSKEWQLPFQTFDQDLLQSAKGDFTSSDFVKAVTGIDNVCERSAVLASGQGKLIQHKTALDGVTAALAVREWRVRFE